MKNKMWYHYVDTQIENINLKNTNNMLIEISIDTAVGT